MAHCLLTKGGGVSDGGRKRQLRIASRRRGAASLGGIKGAGSQVPLSLTLPTRSTIHVAAPRSAPRLIDTWASTLTTSTFCLLCTRVFLKQMDSIPATLVPDLIFPDPLAPSTSQAGTAGAPCPTQQTLSGEKPDHAATATRKRARAASTRGQQRSGARTQPARARTKPARFASPSSGGSSGGSDTDGDHTFQRPTAGIAAGGTASQPSPLSADDWATLQALIAQARGPSHHTSLPATGTSEADPAAAATAALPPSTDRRPRARARGHTSRRRASSSSPSSYDESPEERAPHTFSSPWPGHLRAATGSSIPLLGVHVPQALREKVWANKYVDLGQLLAYERESGSFESHSATPPDAKQPGKKQPPLTPDQWAHGLDIYATIYFEKHPAEAQALFTYARYVKTMKTTLKGDWMWYDQAFRWDRERSGCSWLDYRLDLEFRSVQRIAQAAAQPVRQEAGRPAALSLSSARAAGLPPGYCFAYHSRGPGCTFTSCSFKHYCPRCRRRHPAYNPCPPARPRDEPTQEKRPRRHPQVTASRS
ncbi:nucleolar protein dao-5-like [Procambarus clarkii]|uniref:nucleolar protein dao-5-like n=1 Tax=Procambarus clarkii TaxID=6728 RepID=UPI003743196F